MFTGRFGFVANALSGGATATIAGAFSRIAGHAIRTTQTTGAKHDSLRFENAETTTLAVVTKRANDAARILEQRNHGVFHVNNNALMDAMILQRADEFEARAVADVRETRITMAAEIALRNFSFFCAVEHRAPR